MRTIKWAGGAVLSVSITCDGLRVLIGNEEGAICIGDLVRGGWLGELKGHRGAIKRIKVLAGGRHVLSGSSDATVRLWDLDDGSCLAVYAAPAPVTALSCLADQLVVGMESGQVHIVDVRCGGVGEAPMEGSSSEVYEAALREGLEWARGSMATDYTDALAHMLALAVHLEDAGRLAEAAAIRREYDGLRAK